MAKVSPRLPFIRVTMVGKLPAFKSLTVTPRRIATPMESIREICSSPKSRSTDKWVRCDLAFFNTVNLGAQMTFTLARKWRASCMRFSLAPMCTVPPVKIANVADRSLLRPVVSTADACVFLAYGDARKIRHRRSCIFGGGCPGSLACIGLQTRLSERKIRHRRSCMASAAQAARRREAGPN